MSILRTKIMELVDTYFEETLPVKPFVWGISRIPVSGKVFDSSENFHLVDASLDFGLTSGRFAHEFERDFAEVMGTIHAMLCNSGSSANPLAVSESFDF